MSKNLSALSTLITNYINGLDNTDDLPEKITIFINKNAKNTKKTKTNKDYVMRNDVKELVDEEVKRILSKHKDNKDKDDNANANIEINIETFASERDINQKIMDAINNYVSHPTSLNDGLEILNLCKKRNINNNMVNYIKKQCLHNDNTWGIIVNNDDEYIGLLDINGKINTFKDNNMNNKLYLRKGHNIPTNKPISKTNVIGQLINDKGNAIALLVKYDNDTYLSMIKETFKFNLPIYAIKKN